jgi:hypothetical protein
MMVLTGFGRPALVPGPMVLPLGARREGWTLGQGRLSQAPVSEAARRALQRRITAIASAVDNETQNVTNELELAMGAESYKEIPIIGLLMSQEEVLGQVASDATALGRLVDEVMGASSAYASPDQVREFSEAIFSLDEIREIANREGGRFPGPAVAAPAAEHQELHLGAIRTMKETLQRAIVEAEAGAVPVREPAGAFPWLAVGVGGAVLVAVAALLGSGG